MTRRITIRRGLMRAGADVVLVVILGPVAITIAWVLAAVLQELR